MSVAHDVDVGELDMLDGDAGLLEVRDGAIVVHGVVARLGRNDEHRDVLQVRELAGRAAPLLHARVVRACVREQNRRHQLGRVGDGWVVCNGHVRHAECAGGRDGGEDGVCEGRPGRLDGEDAGDEIGACVGDGPAERTRLRVRQDDGGFL